MLKMRMLNNSTIGLTKKKNYSTILDSLRTIDLNSRVLQQEIQVNVITRLRKLTLRPQC